MRILSAFLAVLFAIAASSAFAKTELLSANPYRGAITLNAADGSVLFESNADAVGYPASVLKLMTLLIVVEKVESGALRLTDRINVTAEAAKMGGSQVYLKEKESFALDEMLEALMIQSANDAALALAIHVAGSRDAFVQLMNQRAQALGMKNTHFASPHGLPPSADQTPDTTTARDLGRLGVELSKHPLVFRYTSQKERGFRDNTFQMRNHNNLLGVVEGVDGFKTGFFRAAGFSILATAQREGVRIIAVVLGSEDRKVRDQKATELLTAGFHAVPRPATPAPSVAPSAPTSTPTAIAATASNLEAAILAADEETEEAADETPRSGGWWKLGAGIAIGVVLAFTLTAFLNRPRDLKKNLLR
ncbi:MAG: D-alanyl-D-alanine carboxypeptidase [Kiritimatiellae bacterium]|nr:D-alanyl-D-alanine carboxypeptidase [Kiritimatiellia bacterium]MCO5067135.1 D-alanyl-D-alanine carboxypeptidase [Kiritimatiellia bacterium]